MKKNMFKIDPLAIFYIRFYMYMYALSVVICDKIDSDIKYIYVHGQNIILGFLFQ